MKKIRIHTPNIKKVGSCSCNDSEPFFYKEKKLTGKYFLAKEPACEKILRTIKIMLFLNSGPAQERSCFFCFFAGSWWIYGSSIRPGFGSGQHHNRDPGPYEWGFIISDSSCSQCGQIELVYAQRTQYNYVII